MAYVQHTSDDIEHMLQTVGLAELDDLFRSIPENIRFRHDLKIPERLGEAGILREFQRLGALNRRLDDMPSFLGAGVYDRFTPAAVDSLSSRGEFNTAYTPYQPEVSQGTLQAIFEYQTMIARLTGMEISNASMYEAGTAVAEAVLMAYAIHGKGERVLVSESVHPEYRAVLDSYFHSHPVEVETLAIDGDGRTVLPTDAKTQPPFAVVVQNPNFFGIIEDGNALREATTTLAAGAVANGERPPLLIVVADPISLGALRAPGQYGADIVVGDGQSLGNDPNLGGPTFGFFATRQSHVRKIPGRVVGETTDRDGKRGYVLTFQTREQHIRRERATSNICTNQGLCCLRGAMTLALLGEYGIRQVAEVSTRTAHFAAHRLLEIAGVQRRFTGPFFQEFVLELSSPAEEVYDRLLERGVRGGLPLSRYFANRECDMLFACTEMTTVEDVTKLVHELGDVLATADERTTSEPAKLENLSR
jgi:glycine dehydrogenase subunit 1